MFFNVFSNVDEIAHWGDELVLGEGPHVRDEGEQQVFPGNRAVAAVLGEEVRPHLLEQVLRT